MAAVAERLGQLGSAVRAARGRVRAHRAGRRTPPNAPWSATARSWPPCSSASTTPSAEPGEEEPSTDERDRLEQAATAARAAETELRLTLRTREERARAMAGRADSLESAARSELAARERAAARRERRRREATVAEAVRQGASYAAAAVTSSLELADHGAGDGRGGAHRTRGRPWPRVRREISTLEDELRELTDSVHRDEVARTQQRLRIETLQTKAVEELGIDPDVLVEEFGPHQLVPVVPDPEMSAEEAEALQPQPFVRDVAGQAAALGRAQAEPARQGQPAGAGGVRRPRGAAQVPHRAAGGPQELQARPARHRARGRRAGREGLHRGLPRHRRAVRARVRAALPRR